MRAPALRRLRRRLAFLVVVYFFAGAASQKLVPGGADVIPLYGWSLFSKVPNEASRYALLVHRQRKQVFDPPLSFLHAPGSVVFGNRYLGRKVIQRLGRAIDRREEQEAEELRRLLEQNYLSERLGYELTYERYDPLQKWKTGANLEERSLGRFRSGE